MNYNENTSSLLAVGHFMRYKQIAHSFDSKRSKFNQRYNLFTEECEMQFFDVCLYLFSAMNVMYSFLSSNEKRDFPISKQHSTK